MEHFHISVVDSLIMDGKLLYAVRFLVDTLRWTTRTASKYVLERRVEIGYAPGAQKTTVS